MRGLVRLVNDAVRSILDLAWAIPLQTGEPPGSFTWVAIGWAVTVTTTVVGLVLSGNLRLGREVTHQAESSAREVAQVKELTVTFRTLWETEKSQRERLQAALEETNNDLRLQNRTLAATVEALQKVAKTGSVS